MTRQLAFDFSHENIKIRVNGIAPGTWTRIHTEQKPYYAVTQQ
jgi:NAD(P)-dependent dehydrogenase (short-subunit alcohol dehydrogenase family)